MVGEYDVHQPYVIIAKIIVMMTTMKKKKAKTAAVRRKFSVFVGFSMSRPYKRNHRYHVLAGSITNKYLFRLNENMIRRESM